MPRNAVKCHLHPKAIEALEDLRKAYPYKTDEGEVVQDAIALYHVLHNKSREGMTIYIGEDGSPTHEIILPYDQ